MQPLDPANFSAGVSVYFTGEPTDVSDTYRCPTDEFSGADRPRTVLMTVLCDPAGAPDAATEVLAVYEDTIPCDYRIVVRHRAGCGVPVSAECAGAFDVPSPSATATASPSAAASASASATASASSTPSASGAGASPTSSASTSASASATASGTTSPSVTPSRSPVPPPNTAPAGGGAVARDLGVGFAGAAAFAVVALGGVYFATRSRALSSWRLPRWDGGTAALGGARRARGQDENSRLLGERLLNENSGSAAVAAATAVPAAGDAAAARAWLAGLDLKVLRMLRAKGAVDVRGNVLRAVRLTEEEEDALGSAAALIRAAELGIVEG